MKSKKAGFTLIELLVVIAIIGLLSSIVMASLNSARVKAQNSYTTQTVGQFIVAIQSALIDNGGLPLTDDDSYCIGKSEYCTYVDGSPIIGHDANLDDTISYYIPNIQDANPQGVSSNFGGVQFVTYSASYTCDNPGPSYCTQASVYYTMQGNVSCGLSGAVGSFEGDITNCAIELSI